MNKIYLSPDKPSTCELVEKRSRFIGNVSHIENESDAEEFIKSIKKKYYDAKHNAYAYICSEIKRYSDDGEPAKTAGMPILEMLEAKGITDVVCVVTRYFGGVLLGTGGLVRAYTSCAKLSLEKSGIKRLVLHDKFKITMPYTAFDRAKHIAAEYGCNFGECEYTDKIIATAVCEEEKSDMLLKRLSDAFGISIVIENDGKVYR